MKKKITKIYRLEDQDGIGIYRTRIVYTLTKDKRIFDLIHSVHNKHNKYKRVYKSWVNEGIQFDETTSLSGCISIDSLKKWFKDFFTDLLDTEFFFLMEYEVESEYVILCPSNRQIVFDKTKVINKTQIYL